jgi:uncharacterized protein
LFLEEEMLIEFRVKNFRSLRDEHVLSLVASKDRTLQETNIQITNINTVPSLLRSAVIYGANASGKSNLIKALQYMRYVIVESAATMQPGQTFNVKPFLLDDDSANHPSEFEITFLLNNVRYQYGFALTMQRIISEHLLVYKAFKPQHWFERSFDPETGKDRYKFSSSLKGQKNLWEGATRTNSLFLSMAAQLNSDQLQPVFNWFTNNLIISNEFTRLNTNFTLEKLRRPDSKQAICNFLTVADIGINDIEVVKQKFLAHDIHLDTIAGKAEIHPLTEKDGDRLCFHHVTKTSKVIFEWEDESDGTRKLVFLYPFIHDILEKGQILVIDELDTSLHTLLVQKLVRLFHCSNYNKNGAQLVFVTHNTSLLNADPLLFRRDQIWFMEKNSDQISELYALSDFSPRKKEALERGYLIGRYGGLPFFTDRD